MKGPGIKDYLEAIKIKKAEALSKGEKILVLQSKFLHEEVSPNHITMPTCCQAMYKEMLVDDQIVMLPKGHSGFGSKLKIEYYLTDLETREVMYKPKKRGRPAKSAQQKELERKLTTEELTQKLESWLANADWQIIETKDAMIIAQNQQQIWVLQIHGQKRGRKRTLSNKINHILKEERDNAKYSIVINDNHSYRKQWTDFSKLMKERLNISMLLSMPYDEFIELD